MAKTYKKISGTWYPIKKIFKRISGTWSEVKKLYKKVSGIWQVVHSGAYEYTFTANASNVDFATLIGAANVSNYTDFKITVNSGVTISGTTGTTGANNNSDTLATGSVGTRICTNSQWADGRTVSLNYDVHADGSSLGATLYSTYYTGTGGTGGTGNHALNLSGLSGKNITIINSGTIIGGIGGAGGMGAKNARAYVGNFQSQCVNFARACALGGSGGSGGYGISNPNGNILSVTGNSASNGSTGAAGAFGWDYFEIDSSGCSCFTKNQKVLMADNTYKNIEDIKVGDKVIGAYGFINIVQYLQKPKRDNRVIWNVDGLLMTSEHGILNGDKDGFMYVSMEMGASEYGTYEEAIDGNGNRVKVKFDGLTKTKRESLHVGSFVASQHGKREITTLHETDIDDEYVYHILVDGDRTYCIEDTFVSSFASDNRFDYKRGVML